MQRRARHVEQLVAERIADEAARRGADGDEARHEAGVGDAARARRVAADLEEHDRPVGLAKKRLRAPGKDGAADHLSRVVDALRDGDEGARDGDVREGRRRRVVDVAGARAGAVLGVPGHEARGADRARIGVGPAGPREEAVGATGEDEPARGRRVLEGGADDHAGVVDAVRRRRHAGWRQQREDAAGVGEAEVVDAVDARVADDAAGAVQPAHVGHDRAGVVDGVEDVDRGGGRGHGKRGECHRRADETGNPGTHRVLLEMVDGEAGESAPRRSRASTRNIPQPGRRAGAGPRC